MSHAQIGMSLLVFLVAVTLIVRPLRRALISRWVMRWMRTVLPKLGATEREALEAGTVWWDGDLFSGRPNWRKLLALPKPSLSPREQAFLRGPVDTLCQMLDDWQVRQAGDLPPAAWECIKTEKFWGIVIPEKFGGLGFSAQAHSAIIAKLASRSVTAAVTVMVPNSLGPAELLLHYGTEEQRRHYLPRLARGEEIPCFALTEPEAGSDAASTQSTGVIGYGEWEGQRVLGVRLNWRKRYITLGPVATVLGVAFKLTDPDRLRSQQPDLGITCALVPANLPGITIGQRHDPMDIPFQNGPNEGRDVFIPAEFLIGGWGRAGQGWRMLMENLAAGRALSLPALATAGMQLATRIVSAYGVVREQFSMPIGRFEGIEEPLARIGGLTYMMTGARTMTATAVDEGARPAVVSAIAKAYLTEAMRQAVNDAMDIRAGAGVCRGPRNQLEQLYSAIPIAITVEGANILTRSLIIYGQGAIRCHPYVRREMAAVEACDVRAFDPAFFGHVGFILLNGFRTFFRGLAGSRGGYRLGMGEAEIFAQRINRMSAAFALVSDAAMGVLGGTLKRREKLSGRLADALAWMYLASGAIKRFEDDGRLPEHVPFLRWSCEYALARVQEALCGALRNFPAPWVGPLLMFVVFPLGRRFREPSDELGGRLAHAMMTDPSVREALTSDLFIPAPDEIGLGQLEVAFRKVDATTSLQKRVRQAVRSGQLAEGEGDLLTRARAAGILSAVEYGQLTEAELARDQAIQVDAFSPAWICGQRMGDFPVGLTAQLARADSLAGQQGSVQQVGG